MVGSFGFFFPGAGRGVRAVKTGGRSGRGSSGRPGGSGSLTRPGRPGYPGPRPGAGATPSPPPPSPGAAGAAGAAAAGAAALGGRIAAGGLNPGAIAAGLIVTAAVALTFAGWGPRGGRRKEAGEPGPGNAAGSWTAFDSGGPDVPISVNYSYFARQMCTYVGLGYACAANIADTLTWTGNARSVVIDYYQSPAYLILTRRIRIFRADGAVLHSFEVNSNPSGQAYVPGTGPAEAYLAINWITRDGLFQGLPWDPVQGALAANSQPEPGAAASPANGIRPVIFPLPLPATAPATSAGAGVGAATGAAPGASVGTGTATQAGGAPGGGGGGGSGTGIAVVSSPLVGPVARPGGGPSRGSRGAGVAGIPAVPLPLPGEMPGGGAVPAPPPAPAPGPGIEVAPVPDPSPSPGSSPGPGPLPDWWPQPGPSPSPTPGTAARPGIGPAIAPLPQPGRSPFGTGIGTATSTGTGTGGLDPASGAVRPEPTPGPGTTPTDQIIPWPGGGAVGGTGQGPRPDLPGIAAEVGRIERKIDQMNTPKPPGSGPDLSDLAELIAAVWEFLQGATPGGSYTLTSSCVKTGEPGSVEDPVVVEFSPALGEVAALQNRIDAIAELLQAHKDLKQPSCKHDPPQGEPVTVNFAEF